MQKRRRALLPESFSRRPPPGPRGPRPPLGRSAFAHALPPCVWGPPGAGAALSPVFPFRRKCWKRGCYPTPRAGGVSRVAGRITIPPESRGQGPNCSATRRAENNFLGRGRGRGPPAPGGGAFGEAAKPGGFRLRGTPPFSVVRDWVRPVVWGRLGDDPGDLAQLGYRRKPAPPDR